MNEHNPSTPLSQTFTLRIKKIFSKGSSTLFLKEVREHFSSHRYAFFRVPKMPSMLNQPVQKRCEKERSWISKKEKSAQDLSFQMKTSSQEALSSHRVKLCKLKEQGIAMREIEAASKPRKLALRLEGHTVAPLNTSEQPFEKDTRMEYWEEMIQNRPERHFNIGRIIKYLSE